MKKDILQHLHLTLQLTQNEGTGSDFSCIHGPAQALLTSPFMMIGKPVEDVVYLNIQDSHLSRRFTKVDRA